MEKIYVETTILGYLASRPSTRPHVAKRQKKTHQWWDEKRPFCRCFCSELVRLEAQAGDPKRAEERLKYLALLEMLENSQEGEKLAELFELQGPMPPTSVADAVHLASATLAGADFLLTWNCAHLANPSLLKILRPLAEDSGYRLPTVCTPEDMVGN